MIKIAVNALITSLIWFGVGGRAARCAPIYGLSGLGVERRLAFRRDQRTRRIPAPLIVNPFPLSAPLIRVQVIPVVSERQRTFPISFVCP